MLFFIILLIVGLAIWANWHYVHIIQQCEKYINLIDTDDNPKNIDKIPECVSFLEKNWTKIRKKAFTDNQYHDKIGDFLTSLCGFKGSEIYQKKAFIYGQQLCGVLTHTIKDKDLKKQIVAEIQNSEYIPKIENNEKDNFEYNILNHFVHKGNPVDWEYIDVEYPKIFKQINTVCLQYLKDNSYYMNALISALQKIGQKFTQPIIDRDNAYKTYQKTGQVSALKTVSLADSYNSSIIQTLGEYLYPKTNKEILEYLVEKKLIDITTAKKYKSILDRTYDKKKAEKEIEALKEIYGKDYSIEVYTENNIRYLYVRYVIEHGDINDYLWLSDKLGRILFRVDSPYRWYPLERSNDDWLKAHKKMLNARTYGINPLLLFAPDDFKGKNSYKTIIGSVCTESVIQLKQDIDIALSNYYPVPNFLNHAKEILDAYITGNTFNAKMHSIHKQIAAWHDNYDRKLREIQLSTLSPYESFGFSVGYLGCALNLEKRIPVKDFLAGELQDSAFVTYLQSMDKEIFDDACELYTRIDSLRTAIYR